MVLFLAYHVERRADRVNEMVTLFPALLLLGWFGFLILIQPDLGTAFCLVLTGAVMLYVAGVRLGTSRLSPSRPWSFSTRRS